MKSYWKDKVKISKKMRRVTIAIVKVATQTDFKGKSVKKC